MEESEEEAGMLIWEGSEGVAADKMADSEGIDEAGVEMSAGEEIGGTEGDEDNIAGGGVTVIAAEEAKESGGCAGDTVNVGATEVGTGMVVGEEFVVEEALEAGAGVGEGVEEGVDAGTVEGIEVDGVAALSSDRVEEVLGEMLVGVAEEGRDVGVGAEEVDGGVEERGIENEEGGRRMDVEDGWMMGVPEDERVILSRDLVIFSLFSIFCILSSSLKID